MDDKIKVALVDDHVLLRSGLRGLVESFDKCTVLFEADNGKDFISKLKKNLLPDIILMDINMPEMNGWECLENLKKEDQLKDIPVIMYSTSSTEAYGKRAINSGALAFYVKPHSFLLLQDFLKSIAESSSGYLKTTLVELQLSKDHSVYTD